MTNPGRPILASTPASMTFLSHSYIPSSWIPLTFTAWGDGLHRAGVEFLPRFSCCSTSSRPSTRSIDSLCFQRSSSLFDSSHTQRFRFESSRCSAGWTGYQQRWKNSLPWRPSAAECSRRTSLPIRLPCHFAQSNCWTGRLSGRHSRPSGS